MFNIKNELTIEENYDLGLLPQRNEKNIFYQESSCRSNLENFVLNSENRRILKKTENITYKTVNLSDFVYTPKLQKQIHDWVKELNWDFPTSSIKKVFTDHIFNRLYIFYDHDVVAAYAVCYFSPTISHVAYLFYDPKYSHQDLPIRCPLQVVIDSHEQQLKYTYLGRFNPETKLGFYKRSFPGFEYYYNNSWVPYINH